MDVASLHSRRSVGCGPIVRSLRKRFSSDADETGCVRCRTRGALSSGNAPAPRGAVTIDAAAAVAGILLLPVNQVAVFALLGGLLGAGVKSIVGNERPKDALMRPARRAATALMVAWLVHVCIARLAGSHIWAKLLIGLIGGFIYMMLDLSVESLLSSFGRRTAFQSELLGRLRMLGSLYAGQVSLGVIVFLLFPRLGFWGFAVVVPLALILQNAYGLYLKTRVAYAQTVDVLAGLSNECSSKEESLESRRLADTAVAIGRRLSLSSHMLEAIGYAALLRDIGLVGGEDRALHAERGADILAEIPILKESALLVRLHHTSADELDARRPSVQIAANILAFCSDYFEREQVVDTGASGIAAFVEMRQAVGTKYFSAVFWAAAEEILNHHRDELEPLFKKRSGYKRAVSVLVDNEG